MSSLFRSRCRPSGCAPLFAKGGAAQWRRGTCALGLAGARPWQHRRLWWVGARILPENSQRKRLWPLTGRKRPGAYAPPLGGRTRSVRIAVRGLTQTRYCAARTARQAFGKSASVFNLFCRGFLRGRGMPSMKRGGGLVAFQGLSEYQWASSVPQPVPSLGRGSFWARQPETFGGQRNLMWK